MQGDRSEDSIISALERIYEYQDCFDAVVIIRGGGATSDLSSFDSYLLAASCAQFPLPVITGIGHERDETVLDIVAHTRAKTPTAVAEFLIDNLTETAAELTEISQDIVSLVSQRLQDETVRLSVFETKNSFALKGWYKEQLTVLSSARNVLAKGMVRIQRENQNKFAFLEDNLKRKSLQLLKDNQSKFSLLEDSLKRSIQQQYKEELNRLETLDKQLHLSSPENILKKGYTLTMKDGKIVKQSRILRKGDEITTFFPDGKVESIVK